MYDKFFVMIKQCFNIYAKNNNASSSVTTPEQLQNPFNKI